MCTVQRFAKSGDVARQQRNLRPSWISGERTTSAAVGWLPTPEMQKKCWSSHFYKHILWFPARSLGVCVRQGFSFFVFFMLSTSSQDLQAPTASPAEEKASQAAPVSLAINLFYLSFFFFKENMGSTKKREKEGGKYIFLPVSLRRWFHRTTLAYRSCDCQSWIVLILGLWYMSNQNQKKTGQRNIHLRRSFSSCRPLNVWVCFSKGHSRECASLIARLMEGPMPVWLVLLCQIKIKQKNSVSPTAKKKKKKSQRPKGFVCGRGRWCGGCSRVGPSLTLPFGWLCSAVVLGLNLGGSHRSTSSRTRAPRARRDPHFRFGGVQNEKHGAQKHQGDWGEKKVQFQQCLKWEEGGYDNSPDLLV